MLKDVRAWCVLVVCVLTVETTVAIEIDDHVRLREVVTELVQEGSYRESELERLFAAYAVNQKILKAMQNPAEYKFTWGRYRKIFLKQERIEQGVQFWNEFKDELMRADAEFGVPPEVIVAIIGVETKFGRHKGAHPVLESLLTLVVGYPRRSAFFASELREFLRLCKENGLDPQSIKGSYAGAVGYPQFISSSYRNYAVDFSKDGSIDLIDDPVDAIGSVANYFIENGWKPGQPVTSSAYPAVPEKIKALTNRKRKVRYSTAQLREKGANLPSSISDQEQLNVLMLDLNEEVNSSERGVYIVRDGDTACAIAERHSMPCRELFKLNKLDSKGRIYRGQKLKVSAKQKERTYQVVVGDTLCGIASRHGVSCGALLKRNSLAVRSIIRPGQTIHIPQESTVAESGWKIKQQQRPVYFYTHGNFYAITRYNHSVLYAMAVHDLSQAIKKAYLSQQ